MRAIVLSGGGSRGAYQIGVWKALRKLKIDYQIVTGTSVGAINGIFMVEKSYRKAKKMWEKICFSDVFDEEIPEELTIKEQEKWMLKSYVTKSLSTQKLNVSALENTLIKHVNVKRFFRSQIDYGLMTVNISQFKSKFITKKEMSEEELTSYVMASSALFPGFSQKEIDGKKYIDGGFYDNLPMNGAISMGATEIIAVDLQAPGLKRKVTNKDVKIHYIKPRNDLHSFLVFNEQLAKRNVVLGYLDTMKTFGKLDGNRYTFFQNQLDTYVKELEKIISMRIAELLSRLKKKESVASGNIKIDIYRFLEWGEEKRVVYIKKMIEQLGEMHGLRLLRIYSISKFKKHLNRSNRGIHVFEDGEDVKLISLGKARLVRTFHEKIKEIVKHPASSVSKRFVLQYAGKYPNEFLLSFCYLAMMEGNRK